MELCPKTKNNLKVKEVAFFGKKILNSKSKIFVKKINIMSQLIFHSIALNQEDC